MNSTFTIEQYIIVNPKQEDRIRNISGHISVT